jgi:hypothetical protein
MPTVIINDFDAIAIRVHELYASSPCLRCVPLFVSFRPRVGFLHAAGDDHPVSSLENRCISALEYLWFSCRYTSDWFRESLRVSLFGCFFQKSDNLRLSDLQPFEFVYESSDFVFTHETVVELVPFTITANNKNILSKQCCNIHCTRRTR